MGTTNLDGLSLSGNLAVAGSTINGGEIDDDITITGTLDVEGATAVFDAAATVGTTLGVTGKVTAADDLDVGVDLDVVGNTTLGGTLGVTGAVTIAGGEFVKVAKIALTAPADGAETDTSFTLPAKCAVIGAFLDISAAEATGATKTLDVGSKTIDPNGFLAAVDVSSTGLVKGTLASGGQTLGALLSVDEDGAGALVREEDLTSGGQLVTITAGSADWSEFAANLYVTYVEIV